MLGNLVSLSIGNDAGDVLRTSAGGLVVYSVLVLLVPNPSALLATSQDWYHDLQPRVDLPYAQSYLFEGMHTGSRVGARRHGVRVVGRPAGDRRPGGSCGPR